VAVEVYFSRHALANLERKIRELKNKSRRWWYSERLSKFKMS
jgi:hypothetical protein